MITERFQEEMVAMVASGSSLRQIASQLRQYKADGLTQDQVLEILEVLRDLFSDDVAEDRILEVMDLVVSFCSPELMVWN